MSYSKIITSFVLVLGLFTVLPAVAETKIGAVNVNKLMEKAPQARSATESLKSKFSARESALLAERDVIKKLEEDYRKNADIISQAEKDSKEKAIRDRLREFKRQSDTFTEDFSLARNEALKQIQTDVYKAIVELAESEGYDLIVSESVLYASEKVDITDKVLGRLGK